MRALSLIGSFIIVLTVRFAELRLFLISKGGMLSFSIKRLRLTSVCTSVSSFEKRRLLRTLHFTTDHFCKAQLPNDCKACQDPAVEAAMPWKLQSGVITTLTNAGKREWEQNQQSGQGVICKQRAREKEVSGE